jgi:ADP-ribose pyrophosphatase YjhB (NUDIX family)
MHMLHPLNDVHYRHIRDEPRLKIVFVQQLRVCEEVPSGPRARAISAVVFQACVCGGVVEDLEHCDAQFAASLFEHDWRRSDIVPHVCSPALRTQYFPRHKIEQVLCKRKIRLLMSHHHRQRDLAKCIAVVEYVPRAHEMRQFRNYLHLRPTRCQIEVLIESVAYLVL